MAKLSTAHGALSQSLKVSLLMFLRVKGLMHYSNQYFLSCLFFSYTGCKCLIVFPEYTEAFFGWWCFVGLFVFFPRPQLPISTWFRGESGDQKLVASHL